MPPGTGSYGGFGNGNYLVRLGVNFPNGVGVISSCAASGDFDVILGPSGPEIVQDLFGNFGLIEFSFCVPNDRVISAIAATFTFRDNLTTQPPTDITIRAEVWVAEPGSRIFRPSGAGVDFNPINSTTITASTTIFADPVNLNVFIPAGSRLLMVFSRTSTTPIQIFGGCSAGILY